MVLVDRLLAAVGEDRREAGLVVETIYQPVGGAGGRVMPPSFPPVNGSPYLLEKVLVDGAPRESVVIDQVPSQANRVEEALEEARLAGRVELPVLELAVDTARGPVRLSSLHAPHRYADAYWRDSLLGGVRFDTSEVGVRLRSASAVDVRPLFEREPYSLLFGAWDSHRPGRQAKFPRLYASFMYGLDPVVGDRRAGRMDPVNLTGASDRSGPDWQFVAEGEKKKGGKLSEIGHGNIAPNPAHGGVTVSEVRRRGWVSFAGLERLRFGDAPVEAVMLARATLAALALVGDRLAFGRASLWLRSGCDLTRISETVGFEVAGGQVEPVQVSTVAALEAFVELRGRAAKAGIVMATDVVVVEPMPQLRKAIEYAVTKSAAAE